MLNVLAFVLLSVSTSVTLTIICYWLYAMLKLPRLEKLCNIVDEFSEHPDTRDVCGAYASHAV